MKRVLKPLKSVLIAVAATAFFGASSMSGAYARPHSDWDEFEDCRACYDNMRMFCEKFKPATNAVLDCLNDHYGALSRACWKALDFFAKKFPGSRWSIFDGKLR